MKRLLSLTLLICVVSFSSCKITLITGYDQTLDETVTQMQKDFNLNFIKLQRALATPDGNVDQAFSKFQDYYDHQNANITSLHSRSLFQGKKSAASVKALTDILIKGLQDFEQQHKIFGNSFKDNSGDNKQTDCDAINREFDSLILLEEKLKASGKSN